MEKFMIIKLTINPKVMGPYVYTLGDQKDLAKGGYSRGKKRNKSHRVTYTQAGNSG